MENEIIYENPDFLICVKQPGIRSEAEGLPAILCAQHHYPSLYPVHRLDQGTGGLILLAKSSAAAGSMTELFSDGKVYKEYLAVIQADTPGLSGTFRDLLFHDTKTNKTYVVNRRRKGVKEASCTWEHLASAQVSGLPFHLVRIFLHTGRTHQIRIQFASRKMPLYGDARYGSKIKAGFPALWASGLSFPDPFGSGITLSFHSTPPQEAPWDLFRSDIMVSP